MTIYTTLNPATNVHGTLSNGNKTWGTGVGAVAPQCFGYFGRRSGKFYYEVSNTLATQFGTPGALFGLAIAGTAWASTGGGFVGFGWDGVYVNGTQIVAYALSNPATYVYSMAVDLGANLIWFRVTGGNWNNSGTANPATGTGGVNISAIATNSLFPYVQNQSLGLGGTSWAFNFGASGFTYSVPSGFTSGWPLSPQIGMMSIV